MNYDIVTIFIISIAILSCFSLSYAALCNSSSLFNISSLSSFGNDLKVQLSACAFTFHVATLLLCQPSQLSSCIFSTVSARHHQSKDKNGGFIFFSFIQSFIFFFLSPCSPFVTFCKTRRCSISLPNKLLLSFSFLTQSEHFKQFLS